MKIVGGVIHGEWELETTQSGEVRRRCPAIVWGSITDDVNNRENMTKKGPSRYLQFRIRLKKGEYIRCTVYPENPCYWIVSKMKKGDFVFCSGRLTAWSYTTKEGESKISIDVYPLFLLPQYAIERMTEVEMDNPDPIFGDDGEPDEDGDASWNPF